MASPMRRHHNNDGRRRIQRGKTRTQVQAIAKRLGVSYGSQSPAAREATKDGSDSLVSDGEDLLLIDVPPSHPLGEREG